MARSKPTGSDARSTTMDPSTDPSKPRVSWSEADGGNNADITESSSGPRRCPKSIAWLVLIAIAGHLAAVLAEPIRFFSQSETQVAPYAATWRASLAPYVEWLYLDHGYFFFAPNPGPSHLVGARILPPTDPNRAEPLRSGVPIDLASDVDAYFPDRRAQWPRLLYHRYFMLSEFYNSSFAPFELPEEDLADLLFVDRWKQDRQFYTQLTGSIAHALAHRWKAESVELMRLERALPLPEKFLREGGRLDDPRGLERLPETLLTDIEPPRMPTPRAPSGPWRSRPEVGESRSPIRDAPAGEVIRP
jgi:hypothetical protein